MRVSSRLLLALAAVSLTGAVPDAASAAPARVAFQGPTGDIRCMLGPLSGRATARCVSLAPRRGVRMPAGRRARVLRFDAVGPLPGGPTLRYGRSVARFGFRCSSARAGITCVHLRSRFAFRISRERIATGRQRPPRRR